MTRPSEWIIFNKIKQNWRLPDEGQNVQMTSRQRELLILAYKIHWEDWVGIILKGCFLLQLEDKHQALISKQVIVQCL